MTEYGNILIVDDTQSALKLLNDMLVAEGFHVRPANSGELALISISSKPPDLILLDIRMPGMDGFEVCRRLKSEERYRDIPIIFLSAHTEIDERIKGLQLGAVDFISKPFEREELLARVRTHLTLRRLQTALENQANKLRTSNEKLEREVAERRLAEERLALKIEQLEASNTRVKHLEGIIPICMYCKKIRDDQDSWSQLEVYITEHSEALFSHGVCPECQQTSRKNRPSMK